MAVMLLWSWISRRAERFAWPRPVRALLVSAALSLAIGLALATRNGLGTLAASAIMAALQAAGALAVVRGHPRTGARLAQVGWFLCPPVCVLARHAARSVLARERLRRCLAAGTAAPTRFLRRRAAYV